MSLPLIVNFSTHSALVNLLFFMATSSIPLFFYKPSKSNRWSLPIRSIPNKFWTVHSSLSSPTVTAAPDDLVSSILSKVKGTDRGVLLPREGHKEVANVAQQLNNYCVDEPVKCPLIFGEWDVEYCSNPTSPGGGYRSTIGRLIFKTNEMVQVVEAPDIIRNKVAFSALGFLNGEVSLKGLESGYMLPDLCIFFPLRHTYGP